MVESVILKAWEEKDCDISFAKDAVFSVIKDLDDGKLTVVKKLENGNYHVNEYAKKAILLYFRLNENVFNNNQYISYDKIPLKFSNWNQVDFKRAGFRALPGSIVRYGAYIEEKAILMPSFINIGSYISSGTMIDSWATVGSCAFIGRNCHISGGAGIGGVLEPIQARPVIIEDDCFIGARSEIAEGVIIRKNSVISMGVYLNASTKIIDRETGEVFYGEVPENSVVVPGSYIDQNSNIGLYAAIIVKKRDEKTNSKTGNNQDLRK